MSDAFVRGFADRAGSGAQLLGTALCRANSGAVAVWAGTVADHTRDDTIAAIARSILAAAPPRFALAGLSMGGYITFEIMRQAPQRVAKLALLDTGARADTAAADRTAPSPYRARRERPLRRSPRSRVSCSTCIASVMTTRRSKASSARWRRRRRGGVSAPAAGDHRPFRFASRSRRDRVSRPGLVGEGDEATPPELAREIAAGIPGSRLVMFPIAATCLPLSSRRP